MSEELTDLGRYKIVRRLALGGMAEVLLAQVAGPAGFSKTVVVKRIHPHLAQDESLVEMFLNEARLAAELNHPNIVQIFELGEADGQYFISMEYIDGLNLRTLSRQAVKDKVQLQIGLVCKIIALACEGLAYAHDFANPNTGAPLNLVHRDISSDNILLSFQGVVKVVDFGIAKVQSGVGTNSGTVKGKIPYMSPEQLRAHTLDRRADVYALGVVLYELLVGARPFHSTNDVSLMQQILREPPAPLLERRPDVPPDLAKVVDRALAKRREDRYPDCRAFGADLEKVLVKLGVQVGTRELADFAHQYAPPKSNPNLASPKPEPVASTSRETLNSFVSEGPATIQALPSTSGGSGEKVAPGQYTVGLEGTAENLLVRLMVSYGGRDLPVEEHPTDLAVLNEGGERIVLHRNVESELKAVQAVGAMGLRYKPLLGRFNAVGETAIGIWGHAKDAFPPGWLVMLPQRARVALRPRVMATVKAQRTETGYRVDIAAASENTPVDLMSARMAARSGKRFVRVAESEYAELDPKLATLDQILTELGETKPAFEVPTFEISNVGRLLEAAGKVEGASSVEAFVSRMKRTSTPPPSEVSSDFTGTLRPYQRAALNWLELLRTNGLNGVLADDAGLGKKVTALAAILNERSAAGEPHLVVCPTAALAQWEQEVRQFAPSLKVSREGPGSGRSLWLLDWDKVADERARLGTTKFGYLVLDEAHLLRETTPAHVEVLKAVTARRRLALTGLPLETRLPALWSVFDLLLPGFLGDAGAFDANYLAPIERDGDEQVRERLKARIQPFLMRRLKREVLTDVPSRVNIPRA